MSGFWVAKPDDYEWLDDGGKPRGFGSKGPGEGSSLPATARQWREAKGADRSGTCANCRKKLDPEQDQWVLGGQDVPLYRACSEICAWTAYNRMAPEWDRERYGACAAKGCNGTPRVGRRVKILVCGQVMHACSRACAQSIESKAKRRKVAVTTIEHSGVGYATPLYNISPL